jgi:uncharacterized protein YggT (Ycf19 family)
MRPGGRPPKVLAAVGSTVWVPDEAQIDGVTAISGSGPAYVFHFIECLQASGEALGFDADTARKLAIDTVLGAARLAAGSAESPAVLRERVTSKGGTTAAALASMAADGFPDRDPRGGGSRSPRARARRRARPRLIQEAPCSEAFSSPSSKPSAALSGVLLARFIMQWQRVSFRNPIGQFVVATTDWLVLPLRRFIPGLGGLDLASLLPAWVVQVLVVFAMLGLLGRIGAANPFSLLAVMWGVGLLETVKVALYLLMGVVLMSAILSWVNPHAPMAGVINALAEPFCARSGASSRSSAVST